MKTISVNIGGKEYRLSGEDEDLVRQTASMVDGQMKELVKKQKELADDKALPLLTALNIAEEAILDKRVSDNERLYLVDELQKMTDTLKQTLELHV